MRLLFDRRGVEMRLKKWIRSLLSAESLQFIDSKFGSLKWKIKWNTDKIMCVRKFRLKRLYGEHTGDNLNLNRCQSLNEKMQWLKVNYFNYKMVYASDKILAKDYLTERGYGEFVPKLLATYRNIDEIDFNTLPDKFVIKTTNGSGSVIVCEDKSVLDETYVKEQLGIWMKQRYGFFTKEWFYDVVVPRILVEECIESDDGGELLDYKLICLNGKMQLAFVTMNRNDKENMYVDFYDRDWNKLTFKRKYKVSDSILPRPKEWSKMVQIAEDLSKEYPLLRVDFYVGKKQLYIGELTFFPGSGWEVFEPKEFDYLYGRMLTLPNKIECKQMKKSFNVFLHELRKGKLKDLQYWNKI